MTDDGPWDSATEHDDQHELLAGAGGDDDDSADMTGDDPPTIRATVAQRARARQAALASDLVGAGASSKRRVTAQGAAVEPREPAPADPNDTSGSRITGRGAAVEPPAPRITAQGAAVEPREPAPADPNDTSGSRITGRSAAAPRPAPRVTAHGATVEPREPAPADPNGSSGARITARRPSVAPPPPPQPPRTRTVLGAAPLPRSPSGEPAPAEPVILLETISRNAPTSSDPRRSESASGGVVAVATGADADRVRRLAHEHGLLIPVMASLAVAHEALSVLVIGEPSPPAPERVVHVVRPSISDARLVELLRALVSGRALGEPPAATPTTDDDPRVAEAARRIATLDDRGAIELVCTEAVTLVTGADRAHCLFHDPMTGALWSESRQRSHGDTRRAMGGLVGWSAQTGQSIVASPAGDDPRWLQEIDDPEGKPQSRFVVQPVLGADRRVHAVLVAIRRWRRSEFSPHEVNQLARLAALAGPRLDLVVSAERARKKPATKPGPLVPRAPAPSPAPEPSAAPAPSTQRRATTSDPTAAHAPIDPARERAPSQPPAHSSALLDPPRAKKPSDPPRRDSRPPPLAMPRSGRDSQPPRPPSPMPSGTGATIAGPDDEDRPSDPTILSTFEAPAISRTKTAPPAQPEAPARASRPSHAPPLSRAKTQPPLAPERPSRVSTPPPSRTTPPPMRGFEAATTVGTGDDAVLASRLPLPAPAASDADEGRPSAPRARTDSSGPDRLPLRAPMTPDPDAEVARGSSEVAPFSSPKSAAPKPASKAPRRRTVSDPADQLVAVVADPTEHERVQHLAELAGLSIAIVDHTDNAAAHMRIITLGHAWLPDLDPRVAYVARATIGDEHLKLLLIALAGGATAPPPVDLVTPLSPAEARRAHIAVSGARTFATADDHATAEAGAVATIRELLDADRAYMLWFDPATSGLRSAIRERERGDDRRAIAGIAGWAARTGRMVHAEHASADPRWLGPIDDPDGDSHSQLLVQPVVDAAGRVRAVFVAARRARRPGFSEIEIALLARFAALAAPLVDQLTLHIQTRALLAAEKSPKGSVREVTQRVQRQLAALPRWTFAAAGVLVAIIIIAIASC